LVRTNIDDGSSVGLDTGQGVVGALAVAEHEQRPLIITGGFGGTVRGFDAHDGRLVLEWFGLNGIVSALTVARVAGIPLLVAGGDDAEIGVWRIGAGDAYSIDVEADVRSLSALDNGVAVATSRGIMRVDLVQPP
jgi:pseudouridine-5'-phosphate glycosidase